MKQQYAVVVLFALIIASSMVSLKSYRVTKELVTVDMDQALAKALDMLKNGASLSEILSFTKNAYLELQFHGELTISDVKYIVFKSESAYKNYVTAEMQKAFDDLGIEVSIK